MSIENTKAPTSFDVPESLAYVWAALHDYQDRCLVAHDPELGNEIWDNLTTSMAWITEALGLEISTADDSTNGEYVQIDLSETMQQTAHNLQARLSTPELRDLIDELADLYEPTDDMLNEAKHDNAHGSRAWPECMK